jgi:phosphopantothenoylcysteine decarboxylase / phosphopantothenate---cysteine ligase
VDVVQVRSAEEMARAVEDRVGPATIVAMAAAVSDYRPAERAPSKLKKTPGEGTLVLTRTPDILATLGKSKGRRFVIGFAAETDRVLENARAKRAAKNADLLVANDVSRPDSGFASDHNAAVLIDAKAETELPLMSKRALADRIWDRVLALRARPSPKALAKRAARPARRK